MMNTSKDKMFGASANNASFFHFSHHFHSKIICHKNLFSTKTIFLDLLYQLQYNPMNLLFSMHDLKCSKYMNIKAGEILHLLSEQTFPGSMTLDESRKFFLDTISTQSPIS